MSHLGGSRRNGSGGGGSSHHHLPPPPIHSHSHHSRLDSSSGLGSLLPISNDRGSSMRDTPNNNNVSSTSSSSHNPRSSKRQRSALDSMDPSRRSPVRDIMAAQAPPPELYLPEQSHPARFNKQMRHAHGMPPPPTGPFVCTWTLAVQSRDEWWARRTIWRTE